MGTEPHCPFFRLRLQPPHPRRLAPLSGNADIGGVLPLPQETKKKTPVPITPAPLTPIPTLKSKVDKLVQIKKHLDALRESESIKKPSHPAPPAVGASAS